jgi:FeS assembly SUF system protein
MSQRHPLPVENEHPAMDPVAAPQPTPAKPPLPAPLSEAAAAELRERIVQALHTCYDPEIPVNIYELGLIYDILVEPSGAILVRMTLTSPGCPVAGTLPVDVQSKIMQLDSVTAAKVDVVWDPPWTKNRMSEAAKLQLGIDDDD